MTEFRRRIGSYLVSKVIGEGTFGKVKLGIHEATGEKVAIKILEKKKICDVSDVERVSREIHILKLIRHPNIIQLYEIIETSKRLYLIMEYADGGELFDFIVSRNKLKESTAVKFYQQLLAGIEYIHKMGVVHRDLKPENLLLDHDTKIKIVDFGLSNTYVKDEKLKTACGSPCYAAPEMIAGQKYNGLKADIWSSGVILFVMLCGYLPFEDTNTSKLYKKIMTADYEFPGFLSQNAMNLIRCVLDINPESRYGLQEIRSHPWLQQKKQNIYPGILIGYENIIVDDQILRQLASFKFDINHVKKCIEANKHNSTTAAYYLLLKRHILNGGDSIADYSNVRYHSSVRLKTELKASLTYILKPPVIDLFAENSLLLTQRQVSPVITNFARARRRNSDARNLYHKTVSPKAVSISRNRNDVSRLRDKYFRGKTKARASPRFKLSRLSMI